MILIRAALLRPVDGSAAAAAAEDVAVGAAEVVADGVDAAADNAAAAAKDSTAAAELAAAAAELAAPMKLLSGLEAVVGDCARTRAALVMATAAVRKTCRCIITRCDDSS